MATTEEARGGDLSTGYEEGINKMADYHHKDAPKIILYNPKPLPDSPTFGVPLSLLAICKLIDRTQYEIIIISDNLYDQPYKKALEECKNAILLGITALTGYQIIDGLKIARLIKEKYPDLPIVWGGWHPTIEVEGTIKSAYVDIVVRGQAERTFPELVDCLASNKPLNNILGISYKENGEIFHTPERPLEDINDFPSTPYHLIDVEKVLYSNAHAARVIDYYSSYGCPFRCTFCAEQTVHKRRWSGLDPYKMADDVERLKKDYRVDAISMKDDQFFTSKERTVKFAEELIRRDLNLKWCNVNGRTRQLLNYEDDIWDLMVKSGLTDLFVGAESGWQEALNFVNKDTLVEETIALAEKLKKYNIKVAFSMLCGLPYDDDRKKTEQLTDKEIKLTLQLVDRLISINPRNRTILFPYLPFPGTPLYQRDLEIGLTAPQSLEDWGKWVYQSQAPWLTRHQIRTVRMFHPYISFFLNSESHNWVSSGLRNTVLKSLVKPVFAFYSFIARLRWKYQFFAFPLDYWLYMLIIAPLARKVIKSI